MFALHMVHGMFPDRFQEKEWDLFSGLIVSDIKTDGHKHERDLPQWLDQDRTTAVSLLKSTLPQVYQSLCLTVSFYTPWAYATLPMQWPSSTMIPSLRNLPNITAQLRLKFVYGITGRWSLPSHHHKSLWKLKTADIPWHLAYHPHSFIELWLQKPEYTFN